jgi:hypothetical protein
MPKKNKQETREVFLTAKVTVPVEMSDAEAARLVKQLVLAGGQDAEDSPDDWHDHDVAKIATISVVEITFGESADG